MNARVAGLGCALVAAAALLAYPGGDDRPGPPPTPAVATAWSGAQRADLPGALPDGTTFHPETFLDARTAIGTAPTPDGAHVRLLLRGDPLRELRRLPAPANPEFGTVTVAGDAIYWTESVDGGKVSLWTATTSGSDVRLVTDATGDTIFSGTATDLVIAEGKAWWVAAAGPDVTEVRSVPLAPSVRSSARVPVRVSPRVPVRVSPRVTPRVSVREEPGAWTLAAWPWLTDGAGVLKSLTTGAEQRVDSTNTEQVVCSPAWCRVLVLTSTGLARIDAMRPDGSQRRRIAGAQARAALNDVAVLDRFELLSEPGPNSDLTGTEGLWVHDLSAGETLEVHPAVRAAFSRNGVLWWATGEPDALLWHTLDLRTV